MGLFSLRLFLACLFVALALPAATSPAGAQSYACTDIGPGGSQMLNLFGNCQTVKNNNPSYALCVTTANASEWSSFTGHPPAGVALAQCGDWSVGGWGGCSNSCGGGSQSRGVSCPYPGGCIGGAPASSQSCTGTSGCTWQYGNWGGCSNSCGAGTQTRTASCGVSGACPGTPVTTQACTGTSCSWQYGNWGGCSNSCGAGTQTRTATCAVSGACPGSPVTTQSCTGTSCSWQYGNWGGCSASCGGGTQTRTASCAVSGACPGSPVTSQSCNTQACAPPPPTNNPCTLADGSQLASGSCKTVGYSTRNASPYGPYCNGTCGENMVQACCSNGTITGSQTAPFSSCIDHPSCFMPYVRIAMADGSAKLVSELKPGDKVQGQTRVNTVQKVAVIPTGQAIYGFNGGQAFVTAGHPFRTTDGKWKAIDPALTPKEGHNVKTEKLEAGDMIVFHGGVVVKVRSIEAHDMGDQTVYNPVMDGDHTYFANGLLVHNKSVNCE